MENFLRKRFASFSALLAFALVGITHAAVTCPSTTTAQSRIYGYAVRNFYLPNPGATPNPLFCSGTYYFKTLEQAEAIIRNDPVNGSPAAGLAFPYGFADYGGGANLNQFLGQQSGMTLDYRPGGEVGASTVRSAPETFYPPGVAVYAANWPPAVGSAWYRSSCTQSNATCNVLGNWCPTDSDEEARVKCYRETDGYTYVDSYFTGSYYPNISTVTSGAADPSGAGRASGVIITKPQNSNYQSSGEWFTFISVWPNTNPNKPTPVYSPPIAPDFTAPNGHGNGPAGGTAEYFPMQKRQQVACSLGYQIDASASGPDVPNGVCQAAFYKTFIYPLKEQQVDQPCVGDPCYPGNGNATVDEDGIAWGNIRYELHYNSLRQVRTYAFIDQNWSASFSQRILTPSLTNSHDLATSPLYVQNELGHVEQFDAVAGQSNAFQSTNHLGDILRKQFNGTTLTGYQLAYAGGEVHSFDTSGRILKVVNTQDPRKTLSISYNLTSVDPGNILYWQILAVSDGNGRSITFQYDTAPPVYALLSVKGDDGKVLMTFSYDSLHRLQYTRQLNLANQVQAARRYYYNEPTNVLADLPYNLTSVADEAHQSGSIRAISLKYDDWGRSTSTWLGSSAEKVQLAYSEDYAAGTSHVDVTTPLGDQVTYDYAGGQPYRRPDTVQSFNAAPGGAMEILTYDPMTHRLTSKKDRRGTETTYEYLLDATHDGMHQSSMTEAAGTDSRRKVETDWDTATNRVTAKRVSSWDVATSTYRLDAISTWTYNGSAQLTARCEYDPSLATPVANQPGTYTCGSALNAPAGVRQWQYTYCAAVGAGCPQVGLLSGVNGPRLTTDPGMSGADDTKTYSYYTPSVPQLTGCGTVGGPCYRPGDLESVTDALGRKVTYLTYDRRGRAVRIRDINGVIVDMTYHPRGWILTSTVRARSDGMNDAADATTSFAYDDVGNITRVTEPDQSYLAFGYDDASRLIDITDALGNNLHFDLDAVGNRTHVTKKNASGVVWYEMKYAYDQLGRLQKVLNSNLVMLQNFPLDDGYDANNNAVHSIDANGVQTRNSYDPLNRLASVVQDYLGSDPSTANSSTGYTYDSRDNLLSVSDPMQPLTTTFGYDGFDDLRSVNNPDSGARAYVYDGARNRISMTDARNVQVSYTYDALNRLVAVTYPTASLNTTYTYDQVAANCANIGRMTTMTDSSGSTTYCYDKHGNVLSKSFLSKPSAGSKSLTTSYSYNIADKLMSVAYPSGNVVSYLRADASKKVTGISYTPAGTSTSTPLVSSITYFAFGPVAKITFANGRSLTKTYNSDGTSSTSNSSEVTGLHVYYGRDLLGTVMNSSPTASTLPPSQTYKYDHLYRLTSSTDASNTKIESYTYNLGGDRLTRGGLAPSNYFYDVPFSSHHVMRDNAYQRSYDANGNTTVLFHSTYIQTSMIFDDRNRMASSTNADVRTSGNQSTTTYDYNGRGERVWKSNFQKNSLFVYDESQQLLEEYDLLTSAPMMDYVYLGKLPIAAIQTSVAHYVETDGRGTPRLIVRPGATPASDTVTWVSDILSTDSVFEPNLSTSPIDISSVFKFYLVYPGQYWDPESRLYYNVFRDYDPVEGKYIESDPLGVSAGTNTYTYVANNPLSYVDQLGLDKERVCCTPIADKGNILHSYFHCFVQSKDDNGTDTTYALHRIKGGIFRDGIGCKLKDDAFDRSSINDPENLCAAWKRKCRNCVEEAHNQYPSPSRYYAAGGPNSNTYASFVAKHCGLPMPHVIHTGLAPGGDDDPAEERKLASCPKQRDPDAGF